jgi:hypothetical protein
MNKEELSDYEKLQLKKEARVNGLINNVKFDNSIPENKRDWFPFYDSDFNILCIGEPDET